MSLTGKVNRIVILVFVLSAAAGLGIQKFFILPSFIGLEKETARGNVERVLGAIDREIEQIVPFVADWSVWTETYDFAKGDNPDYIADNLDDGDTLQGLNMDYMGIYNSSGKVVWEQGLDSEGELEVKQGEFGQGGVPADHPLLQYTDLESVVKGIIITSNGPLMVVSKPIVTNEKQGPPAGIFILGRLLDDSAVERMGVITRLVVGLDVVERENPPLSWIDKEKDSHVLKHSDFIWGQTRESWQLRTVIWDIFDRPVLTLQVDTAKDISVQGQKAVQQALLVWLVIALITMWLLRHLLHRGVLRPIARLTQHALHIGENCQISHVHFGPKRGDEIGLLARSFDEMVDRLAETRSRLMEQSYQAGIAEMASGVLHNIGNAITPLNIRLSTLQQRCKRIPLAEMEQAVTELADPAISKERRSDLLQFQKLATDEMVFLLRDGMKEIGASLQQVRLLEDILNDQQRFCHSARIIEPVDMGTVINDVETDFGPELQKVLRVEISSDISEIGAVAGSRAALQQVVANLLLNASESIEQAAVKDGVVTVLAACEEWQGHSMMALSFQDNGLGIEPVHLDRLFERGFSTKGRDGSGWGLHWCANTLQSLGGTIVADNNKDGIGACFKLLLPLTENLESNGIYASR